MKFYSILFILLLTLFTQNIYTRILTNKQINNNKNSKNTMQIKTPELKKKLNNQNPIISKEIKSNSSKLNDERHLSLSKNHLDKMESDKLIDLANGEKLGRELMLSEIEYPQIGIVNLDSGDFLLNICLLYTSPSPRDLSTSRMPSSA